ncbi:MAG: 50S ribosomal protein L9 [Flavobacteriales bacterium]|nr:50S ribosomal protein L9 [Flavobacteriales bacterium]
MEIILIKDVENLGFKDDVVSVKNGYGRNYLIPQGFALLATPSAKKQLDETLRQRAHKEAQIVAEAKAAAEQLKAVEMRIAAKAGKTGKLFGSVTTADLAEELSKMGHLVDKKFIQVAGGAIKATGKYTAKVRLHRDVIASIDFEVVAIAE